MARREVIRHDLAGWGQVTVSTVWHYFQWRIIATEEIGCENR